MAYFYGLAVNTPLFYGILQKKFPESLRYGIFCDIIFILGDDLYERNGKNIRRNHC